MLFAWVWGLLGIACSTCERLADEEELNCTACVEDIPINGESCTRTLEDEQADEIAALFDDGEPSELWNESSVLFTEGVLKIDLFMTEENWEFLRQHPTREEYAPGDMRISRGNEVIGNYPNVAMRFKGFIGSLRKCLDCDSSCRKLNWKIKVDKYDEEQRVFGLKRLQFHASRKDVSPLATLFSQVIDYF